MFLWLFIGLLLKPGILQERYAHMQLTMCPALGQ